MRGAPTCWRGPDRRGTHGSVTPGRTLQKLEADLVIRGEFEQVLPKLAGGCRSDWDGVCALAYDVGGRLHITGPAHEADMTTLPILEWPAEMIRRHQHHHHRFDMSPVPARAQSRGLEGLSIPMLVLRKTGFPVPVPEKTHGARHSGNRVARLPARVLYLFHR